MATNLLSMPTIGFPLKYTKFLKIFFFLPSVICKKNFWAGYHGTTTKSPVLRAKRKTAKTWSLQKTTGLQQSVETSRFNYYISFKIICDPSITASTYVFPMLS